VINAGSALIRPQTTIKLKTANSQSIRIKQKVHPRRPTRYTVLDAILQDYVQVHRYEDLLTLVFDRLTSNAYHRFVRLTHVSEVRMTAYTLVHSPGIRYVDLVTLTF